MQMFADADYSAVSMEQLASSVGIKKASLYFHFKNKEEILRSVLDVAISSCYSLVGDLTKKAQEQKSLVSALHTFLSGYVEYIQNKAVLQFWTRMYILPPPVLTKEDQDRVLTADKAVFEGLSAVFGKFSNQRAKAVILTLLRILGGYISLGIENGQMSWKDELLLEIKVILRGFMPRKN